MTDREFRRLRRSQLIEIIYELKLHEEQLEKENEELKRQLEEKRSRYLFIGSLAQEALVLQDLFQRAQAAADAYVEAVKERVEDAGIQTEKQMEEAGDHCCHSKSGTGGAGEKPAQPEE